jgi:hypothetical protein
LPLFVCTVPAGHATQDRPDANSFLGHERGPHSALDAAPTPFVTSPLEHGSQVATVVALRAVEKVLAGHARHEASVYAATALE